MKANKRMENGNLIDKLHEADMLYFVFGSLISADSLIDVEACHKALDCLENLKRDFETSTLKNDQKLKSFLDNAESIIKRDMNHFEEESTNKLKDTFWQRRELRGMDPILLEVLEVEEPIGIRDICKVRWHILGHDSVSTSVFPMASITPGHLADFVSIPREEFQQALDILKDTTIDYTSRKRRILYLLRKYNYTDDEPLVISK